MLRFYIITLFPDVCRAYCEASILGRAQQGKLIKISYINPRDFSRNKHRKADDRPYGGGPGMVMLAEPILRAVDYVLKDITRRVSRSGKKSRTQTILFSPGGKQFTNTYAARAIKKYTDIILIAGRYEGVDARVKKILKAEEWSIGPFILTGGEIPATAFIDACARQVEGVLGTRESLEEVRSERGQTPSSEVYTRPEVLKWKRRTYRVPSVLFEGDHKKIEIWRRGRLG